MTRRTTTRDGQAGSGSAKSGRAADRPSAAFRATAALRVSFAGGGTDLPGYAAAHGGIVLTAAIDRLVVGRIWPLDGELMTVSAPDLGLREELGLASLSGLTLTNDDPMRLILAVLRRCRPGRAFHLEVSAGGAPGGGLGGSGAVAAVVAALVHAAEGRALTPAQAAELAFSVEAEDLGLAVGRQDPYGAVFAGVKTIRFDAEGAHIEPLPLAPGTAKALDDHLALVRGPRRLAAAGVLLRAQQTAVRESRRDTLDAMAHLKELAGAMRVALIDGDIQHFAALLSESDATKQRSNPAAVEPRLDRLLETAREAGALSGKRLGAGGGGHVVVLVPPERRADVAEALAPLGAKLERTRVSQRGLVVQPDGRDAGPMSS